MKFSLCYEVTVAKNRFPNRIDKQLLSSNVYKQWRGPNETQDYHYFSGVLRRQVSHR